MFFSTELKAKRFWKWFEKNIDKLDKIQNGDKNFLFQIKNRLNKINKYLTIEVGINNKAGTKNQLIISADGIIIAFEDVLKIVKSAPTFLNWEVKAFRQKKSIKEISLAFDDFELTADKLYFTYFKDLYKNSDLVNLNVYIKGIKELNDDIRNSVFLFLDSAIGEFNVGTRIGRVGMGCIEEYQAQEVESTILPLEKLDEVISS